MTDNNQHIVKAIASMQTYQTVKPNCMVEVEHVVGREQRPCVVKSLLVNTRRSAHNPHTSLLQNAECAST
jgi:hypothetical protein